MTYDPSKFYVWQAPGKLVTVHLSLDVVDKLNRARAEFDGDLSAVLLGYSMIAPQRATFVDDYVLLPQTWNLQGGANTTDFETTRSEIVRKLANGAENGRHAIGFCRWQQEGPLELSESDFGGARRFFAERDNVLLLIRSLAYQVGEAALFFWDDGRLQVPDSASHFQFDRVRLSSFTPEPAPVSARTMAPPPPPAPPEPPKRRFWSESSGEPIRWGRLLPLVALLSLGIAAAELAYNRNRPASPETAQAATIGLEDAALGLRVTSRPKQLEIRWNHNAKPVLSAAKGEMRIADGAETEVIAFEPQQLQDGAVAYTPLTNDVNIRLKVTGADGTSTAESVRAIAIP